MDIRRITDDFAISDQLTQKDVTQAHALGYETILCMRPDDNMADFAKLYKDLPKPVLAYCRSGGRVLKTFQRAFPKDA